MRLGVEAAGRAFRPFFEGLGLKRPAPPSHPSWGPGVLGSWGPGVLGSWARDHPLSRKMSMGGPSGWAATSSRLRAGAPVPSIGLCAALDEGDPLVDLGTRKAQTS